MFLQSLLQSLGNKITVKKLFKIHGNQDKCLKSFKPNFWKFLWGFLYYFYYYFRFLLMGVWNLFRRVTSDNNVF